MKRYNTFVNENKIKVEIPIPKDVDEIAKAFHKAGKDLFVVGGAVRDFLQNKVPHDFDLVTNALPEETKKILKGWNVSDEQGKNFGVLRIFTEDEPLGHEIATYRKDIAKGRDVKGDEEKVEIGNHITINDDVLRRDLTINALFYDINKKEIVDLVGGVKDIENGIIRSVGVPKERFNEDRLRILRVFRFAARTGGQIDSITSQAIKDDNRLRGIGPKDDVSQERIHEEWNKVIEHAESGGVGIMERYIELLTEYDMWEQMFPGLEITPDITIDFLENSIIFYDLFDNVDFNKKRKYLIETLKFNGDLVNELYFLQEYHNSGLMPETVYKLAKLRKRFHISEGLIRDFVKHEGNRSSQKRFMLAFFRYCDAGFVVNGNDLIEQGFKGAEIEKEKERLEIERFKNEYMSK